MSSEPVSAPAFSSQKPSLRQWVWCSSDESIARGQISLLAVLEIPCAITLFWWVTKTSPWPWFTVVGLMAAPLLLLRSPESVAGGVKRFRVYLADDKPLSGWMKFWKLLVPAMLLSSAFGFLGARNFLMGLQGWELFFGSAVVGVGAVAGAGAFAVAGALAGVVVRAVAFAVAVAVAVQGVGFGVGIGAGLGVVAGVGAVTAMIFLFPIVVGLFLRITAIRFFTTLRYLPAGLGEYAENWRETVLVIDLLHLPELLPGAAFVHPGFSFVELWRMPLRCNSAGDPMVPALLKLLLLLIIFISALLYRWNIKASSWLWGPLAFVLRPVVWVNEEAMRSKTSFWTTWVIQSMMGGGVLMLIGWLSLAFLPSDLAGELPNWLRIVQAHWPAPGLGVRYALLWCVVFAMTALLFTAYRVRAAHNAPLEASSVFDEDYKDHQKAEFTRLALPVRRLLRWNLAVIALTIWTFALWWSLARWPAELNGVVWVWVKPWL